jgi:glycosyltransferase involved in cell wall biosynthesis
LRKRRQDSVRVSIGLPVFNGDRYPAGALDSSRPQTYLGYQLTVSGGASTYRTQAIRESNGAKDSRIHLPESGAAL